MKKRAKGTQPLRSKSLRSKSLRSKSLRSKSLRSKSLRSKSLRTLAEPFVVAPPRGQAVTTRLHPSERDELVLLEVAALLTRAANKDLADRVKLGAGPKHLGRTQRKQQLTAATSSRWAGTITRNSDDQHALAMRGLVANRETKIHAIKAIEERLAIPTGTEITTGSGRNKKTIKGYYSQHARWLKQQRRDHLLSELNRIEAKIASGHPSIVRGGKKLLNTRHHLAEVDLTSTCSTKTCSTSTCSTKTCSTKTCSTNTCSTKDQWAEQWNAARMFLCADGEKDALWGNQTIRVNPDTGVLTLRLPSELAHLSNTDNFTLVGQKVPTYVLDASVKFSYHADDWAAQASTGAVGYSFSKDPKKSRWYLSAAWTAPVAPAPSLVALKASNTLGVDLNADHLAAWVISPTGTPLGEAVRIELDQTGSTSTRDGHLRMAISELLHLAKKRHCASVTVENLNFADARDTGRETPAERQWVVAKRATARRARPFAGWSLACLPPSSAIALAPWRLI